MEKPSNAPTGAPTSTATNITINDTNNTSNVDNANISAGDAKGAARESRLSNRRLSTLRRKYDLVIVDECKTDVAAFANCAQEQGLMVVFKCREENRRSKFSKVRDDPYGDLRHLY
jgi:hypothetical protein